MTKITKRFIDSIKPDRQKTLIFWDTELIGFGVVVLPSGRKTYCVQYRNSNRVKKRLKIGLHGHITAEEARDLAKKYMSKVIQGEDPAEKKKEFINQPTVCDLAKQYLERHAEIKKRPRSVKADKFMLNNYILKEFSGRKVDQISFEDIQKLHSSLNKTRVLSNRILALLHKMFSLAVQWKWRSDNPVTGIEKYQENKRTRWLQKDELIRLSNVLESYPNQTVSNIVRLLLLTGARKHEVLEAMWDQFDLDNGVWTKKAHHTKQKKMEHTPLSPAALDILRIIARDKKDSPFLFPGKIEGAPLQDIKKSWATICKQANLEDCHVHDLRHTYASHLASSGFSSSIIGKLLGHTQASTTQKYMHLADEPLREATALFAEKLKELSS